MKSFLSASPFLKKGWLWTMFLLLALTARGVAYAQCTVTSAADSGAGTLRNCVNSLSSGGTITFDSGLNGSTIALASTITINANLTIQGPGANLLTIDGGGSTQLFINFSSIVLSGLTLAHGNAGTGYFNGGGAIRNYGTANIANCAFNGNFVPVSNGGGGGAIYNGGTFTITGSTFYGNTSVYMGGGAIYNFGYMAIIDSTFVANSVSGFGVYGGAILNGSSMNIYNSTIVGNTASGQISYGGGITNIAGGSVTLDNDIVAGNWVYGQFGSYTGSSDCPDSGCGGASNIFGANPSLSAFGYHGGFTQTMIPLPGSSAICAGTPALIPSGTTTDQRGFTRNNTAYTGYNSSTPCLDVGAVQTNYQSMQWTNAGSGYGATEPNAISPGPIVSVTENGQNMGDIPVTLQFSGTAPASSSGLGPVVTVSNVGATFSSILISPPGSYDLFAELNIVGSDSISTGTASFVVSGAPQTISALSFSPTPLWLGGTTTVSATASSGLTVTFTSQTPATCSVTGVTVHGLATGTCTIAADQGGNSIYLAAPEVTASLTVYAHLPSIGAPAPSGLISWWPANGNGNDPVSGNNATLLGATYATGESGQAFSFSGGSYASVADVPSLHVGQFSLSTWFNWSDQGTDDIEFLTGKAINHFELQTGGTGVNNLRFIPAGSPTIIDAPNAIQPGWNHVVATYDGSNALIYINGTLTASRTGITGGYNLTLDTSPLRFGKRGDGSYPYNGLLDEVQLYNRALTASEVTAIYNAGTASITLATPSYGLTTATLGGAVNDNGADTTVTVEYGTTTGYGSSVSATPSTVTAGSGVTSVSASLSSLAACTLYHFRIDAVNTTGTTHGSDQSFTTLCTPTISISNIPADAVYGGSFTPSITYSGDGVPSVASNSTSICTVSGGVVHYVGAGTCSLTASATAGVNYVAAPGSAQTFQIGTATLTITASNESKTYGATFTPNGTTQFTTSGLLNSDTVTSVTLTSSGYAATAGVSGSPYSIVPSAASGTGLGNYSITYTSGQLTVNAASLTVTANGATKSYGAANPSFSYTPSGFVNGDTASVLTGAPSLTTTATAASPVGSYTITAAAGTLAASNYSFLFVNGALTVNQAVLTITASSPSVIFGASVPTITPSYSGFVNGDTPSMLTTAPACTTVYTTASKVGSLPATSCSGAVDANYDILYVAGAVTITQATPAVTWSTPSAIKYGTALSGTQLNATFGAAGNCVYTPASGTVLAAGTQTLSITCTPTDGTDYTTATQTMQLTVNKVPLSVTVNNQSMTYGGTVPALTGTLSGVVGADGITASYATTGTTSSPVSTYPITATLNDPNSKLGNYTVTNTAGTLSIGKVTSMITWATPAAITYGTALSTAQLDATANVGGTYNYSPALGTVLSAGTQTLSVTFTPTDATDYTTATQNVQLTVNKAMPTVTWATPTAIIYPTALSSTQLNTAASVPGSFVYTPAAGTILTAGNYTLCVAFTPTDSIDYTTATATVTLTVNNPVPVINILSPAFTNAGGSAFTLTVTGSGLVPISTIYWGTTALTTTYVSATQLTAQVGAAYIANAGISTVSVQTPSTAPGGGVSNLMQFEVDATGSTTTSPTFTSTTTATVTAGSTANYPVTLPSNVKSISVTCLNLPAGASCSYSQTTKTVTITTSSTTPKGTYRITVIFTETVVGVAGAGILLPILLLPLLFIRRKLTARGAWITACLGIVLTAAAALSIGCSGGGFPNPVQMTSSGTVDITIQ